MAASPRTVQWIVFSVRRHGTKKTKYIIPKTKPQKPKRKRLLFSLLAAALGLVAARVPVAALALIAAVPDFGAQGTFPHLAPESQRVA